MLVNLDPAQIVRCCWRRVCRMVRRHAYLGVGEVLGYLDRGVDHGAMSEEDEVVSLVSERRSLLYIGVWLIEQLDEFNLDVRVVGYRRLRPVIPRVRPAEVVVGSWVEEHDAERFHRVWFWFRGRCLRRGGLWCGSLCCGRLWFWRRGRGLVIVVSARGYHESKREKDG